MIPTQLPASLKSNDFESPGKVCHTFCATPVVVKTHIRNNANHEKNCTIANLHIVSGISFNVDRKEVRDFSSTVISLYCSYSFGGYSLVLKVVQRTVINKAPPPK